MKYDLILADPPWWYNSRKTGGERNNKTKFGGGAQKHYPLIKDKMLLRLARVLPRYCERNSILFMWATYPRLDLAIQVMQEAGFNYKTVGFTWLKTTNDGERFKYGPGFYTASNPEICLIGVRGSGFAPKKKMLESIITTPRYAHSVKPDLHDKLDEMYPFAQKIELFARRATRPNWTFWGNQLTGKTEAAQAIHVPEVDDMLAMTEEFLRA